MRGLFSHRPHLAAPVISARFVPAGVGLAPNEFTPGDFVLTQGHSWVSRLIRFGQKLRFRSLSTPYAFWSHSALIVDSNGTLIEAMSDGIKIGHLDNYRNVPYSLVRVDSVLGTVDRQQAIAFAHSCLGWKYGYFTFVSIALSCLTGGHLSFGRDSEVVCSGLVASALVRGSAILPRDPRNMTPGDLAKFFGVVPPT